MERNRRLREFAKRLVDMGVVSADAWFFGQPADGGKVLIVDVAREVIFLHHAGYQQLYRPSELIEYELKVEKRAVELAIVVLDSKHPSYEFRSFGSKAKTDFRHVRGLLIYLKNAHETDKAE